MESNGVLLPAGTPNDHAFEIVKLLLDKGLLAIIGGLFAYFFSLALDLRREKFAWARARADQRLASYREVMSILAAQLVDIRRFANVVEAVNTKENVNADKAQAVADGLVQEIIRKHFEFAPKLLLHACFMAGPVQKPLENYQRQLGRFSELLERSTGDDASVIRPEEVAGIMTELHQAWTALSIVISNEFHGPPPLASESLFPVQIPFLLSSARKAA